MSTNHPYKGAFPSTRLILGAALLLSGNAQGKQLFTSFKQQRAADANNIAAGGVVGFFKSSQPQQVEPNVTLSTAMLEVQSMIINWEKESDCKRMAIKNHAQFCQSFDDSKSGAFITSQPLKKSEQLFALQMTQCSLEESKQSLPEACAPVLGLNAAQNPPQEYIERCLVAMSHDKDKKWTTYEAVKAQGLVICQSMRAEMDKDKQLHFYSMLHQAYGDLASAYEDQQGKTDQLLKDFENVQGSMSAFNQQFKQDHIKTRQEIQDTLGQVQSNAALSQEAVSKLAESIASVHHKLAAHSDAFQSALAHATELSKDVSVVHQTELAKFLADLDQLRNQKAFELSIELQSVSQQVYAITNSVELANSLTSKMASRFDAMNMDLDSSLGKVSDINSGMVDTLTHQERMNKNLLEMDVQVNQTRESVEATQEQLGKWKGVFENATNFVQGASKLGAAFGLFVVMTITFSLLAAALLWAADWSTVPAILSSSGIGIGLSGFFSFVYSPFVLVQNTIQRLGQHRFADAGLLIGIGMVLGGLLVFITRKPADAEVIKSGPFVQEYVQQYGDDDFDPPPQYR